MEDFLAAYDADAAGTPIGGGSVARRPSDHVVCGMMVMQAAGRDAPRGETTSL